MAEKEKISFELEKYIERKIPELRLEPKPKLDEIICAFLEKFEVYVKPITTKTRNIAGSAAAGAITGMYGADVGGDAFLIQGQKRQTAIQEWTKWKQWALSHPDFLDYKQEIFFRYEDRAYEIKQLIKTPEIKKKIEECKKQFHKEKKEKRKFFFTAITIILGIPLTIAIVMTAIKSVGNIINESNSEKIK